MVDKLDAVVEYIEKVNNFDGFKNLALGFGDTARDKTMHWEIGAPEAFGEPQLSALYEGHDLAQRICRLPAAEMTREGVDLAIDGDDDYTQERAVYKALKGLHFWTHLAHAITFARAYGGAGVFVGADDGRAPDQPLDVDNIKTIRYLKVFDRYELVLDEYDEDVMSPTFGEPKLYSLYVESENDPRIQIHASRVLIIDGTTTSRRKRRKNQGWADSVFVKLFNVLKAYEGSWKTVEALMSDFAQGVIKLRNLAEIMAADGENEVLKRLQIMKLSSSSLGAMVLDADMEDFQRKATPMAGLPDILQRWMARMSAAAEMPQTLLFGISPGGIANDGNSEAENWSNAVKSMQEEFLRPQLEYFLTLLFASQDGPTNGAVPEGWTFKFRDIRQLNLLDEAKRRKTIAETDNLYFQIGALFDSEIALSRFGGQYSTETKIDLPIRQEMLEMDKEQALEPEPTEMELLEAQAKLKQPAPSGAGDE